MMKALTQLTTTLIGTGWKRLQADANVELAQLQAIATAAREAVKAWEARKYIKAIEMKPEMDKLAAALAALEQETK